MSRIKEEPILYVNGIKTEFHLIDVQGSCFSDVRYATFRKHGLSSYFSRDELKLHIRDYDRKGNEVKIEVDMPAEKLKEQLKEFHRLGLYIHLT